MNSPAPPSQSFSIIVETANLQFAEQRRLIASLDSIAHQTPSPSTANEVVILDSGEAEPGMLELLTRRYPWITVRRIPEGVDYGDQKALAVSHASGDIVLFADSDCLYEQGWLASYLEAFAARPDIEILAGETAVEIAGPFTLAMGLVFFFPRFSYETEVVPARGFFGNNVAFRRTTLTKCPFPSGLPMYRAQNVVHSRLLREAGIPIWRQPGARSVHSPPEGVWSSLWRFLAAGRDNPRLARLSSPPPDAPFQGDYEPYDRPGGRLRKLGLRVFNIFRQQPLMLLWLPIALPIAVGCVSCFFMGAALERVRLRRSPSALGQSEREPQRLNDVAG